MTMHCRSTTLFALASLLCISRQAQQVAAANSSSLLNVTCNFGDGSYSSNYSFELISNSIISGTSRRCEIFHITPALLRISLDSDDDTIESLYAVVFDKIDVRFVAEADVLDFQGSKAYHFQTCPLLHTSGTAEISIVFFSTPDNGTFSMHIELDEKDIEPGETKAMTVRQDGLAEVMAFDVRDEDLFKLLEVTATSDSEEVVYYLFVSKNCAMVQWSTSNNQTSGSQVIKLTFSRFGRLTLSQFSHPKISPGRWYIGVQIKDAKRGSSELRSVNISVAYTYYYATIGKAGLPVLYMMLITFLGGTAIAAFAHFFLNSDFEELNPLVSNDDQVRKAKGKHNVRVPGMSFRNQLPSPLPRKTCPIKTWGKVISIYWLGKGVKTFSYTTGVLAIAFGVGSTQFVIARWSNMIEAGDRDLCYYNERCYRPIAFADIPSNFMLSNIPYIIHGLILATSISFREAICAEYWSPRNTHRVSIGDAGAKKMPYDFSVAYSFSWALVFEGLFSAIYHLCPSRLTFQFDSAFMFIISGLVVVALYNSHVMKTRSGNDLDGEDVPDGLLYSMKAADETPIQAPKYFLFFVSPLLLLNYAGSVHNTAGLPVTFEVVYWIVLVVWLLALYVWAYSKLGLEFSRDCWNDPALLVKWFCFLLFPICLLVIGMTQYHDWSQFFLFSCIAATALSIVGLIVFDLVAAHQRYKVVGHSFWAFCSNLFNPKTLCSKVLSSLHRIVFVVIMFLFWVFAMYFFKLKPTAKKVALPHVSRTYNKECVLWDFFDYHDIWHMLSSFALFMSAYLLIYVTRKVEKIYWAETKYWRSKETQKYSGLQGNEQVSQGAQTQGAQTKPSGHRASGIPLETTFGGGLGPEDVDMDEIQPYVAENVTRREKMGAGQRVETQWKRESLV